MNERIRELAAKAGIYGAVDINGNFDNEAEVKKFAELIVRECISKIEDELANARCVEPREWGYVSGLSVATEIILQQFGSERMKQAVYVGKVNDETGELE